MNKENKKEIQRNWDLGNERTDFEIGDKVKTRGDMGGFNLVITKIHNNHYCECNGYSKIRHFNMNVLEKL